MTFFLSSLLLGMVAIQGLIMTIDEFFFHRRRGLKSFERWGHVADTCLFFLALLVLALARPSPLMIGVYSVLAVASSLLITKDEWIHAEACGGREQWCHALLFILHGPILLTAGLLWYFQPETPILRFLPLLIFSWGLYQFFYWNVYHDTKRKPAGSEQSVLR